MELSTKVIVRYTDEEKSAIRVIANIHCPTGYFAMNVRYALEKIIALNAKRQKYSNQKILISKCFT